MPDDPHNLDLIRMVQNARMQHDRAVMPSQVSAVYWIESKPLTDSTIMPTPRSGEFRITVTLNNVDAQWTLIRQATEAGELGHKSRVSTQPAPGQQADERLICVRTVDGDDLADRTRIQQRLKELAFPADLNYYYDNVT